MIGEIIVSFFAIANLGWWLGFRNSDQYRIRVTTPGNLWASGFSAGVFMCMVIPRGIYG